MLAVAGGTTTDTSVVKVTAPGAIDIVSESKGEAEMVNVKVARFFGAASFSSPSLTSIVTVIKLEVIDATIPPKRPPLAVTARTSPPPPDSE